MERDPLEPDYEEEEMLDEAAPPSGMRLWIESMGMNADLVYFIVFLSVIVLFILYRVRNAERHSELRADLEISEIARN